MSQSFLALGVSTPVVRALDSLQIHHPFAVQQLVLPDALAGLDILAESPTGSGKTLAFGLPLVERTVNANGRPAALVLVPTRELATQVAADLRPLAEAKGLRVATVYGGVPLAAQARKAKGAHVLVATPGRLHDLMERRMIALDGVRVLVLDEADRMLDMGFKPQVDRILRTVPAEPPDDALLGDVRRRRCRARPRLHGQPLALQGGGADREAEGRDRAHLRPGDGRRQARQPRRAAEGRAWSRTRLRPHEARRRQARTQAREARHRSGADARQPLAEPA